MTEVLLTLLVLAGAMIALPITTYFCVKLGTYAHLRAKELFNKRGETSGQE